MFYVTGERPFSCHLCSYSTAYAYVLKKHIENHPEQDEKFNCDYCDYFTNSSVEFKRHIKTHSGRSMFCCHFCGYISLNSDHFKVRLSEYKCSRGSIISRLIIIRDNIQG